MGNDFLFQSFGLVLLRPVSNIGFLIFIYGDKSEPGKFHPLRLGCRIAG